MSTSETSPTVPSPTEARTTTTTFKASFTSTTAAASASSSKGFQVTHTSYQQGSPPFRTASPPMAPAAFAGPRDSAAAGSPLLTPQLPPSSMAGSNAPPRSPRLRCSSSSATAPGGTPPLGPRTAAVPLITPRYQKKSRTTRQMNVTDSFPEQQTPSGALRQEATELLTVQSGPMQYEQEVHFHTYDVYRHGKRQIHTRSVGYSSDGDLVMLREDYSEPSDVDNGFVRKRTEISDPTVLDPRARRPLTEKELQSKQKLHLNRPRYKKYPGIRAPKNRKVRNRLLNDYFAHELAREILMKAQKWRELKGDEPTTPTAGPSFADLPKAVMHAMDLVGEEQLLEFERLHIHPDVLAPQLRNVKPPPHPDSPEGRFQGLNTRLRGELQHALNSEFLTQQIEDLEVHFTDFIKNGAASPESLVFYFRDGYGRLICHGVAAYYLLVSESHTVMDGSGTKLTYVSLPKTRRHGVRAVNPPHVPLLLVLRRNRRNLPAKHSLSAQNTPKVAPARDPVAPPPLLGLESAGLDQASGTGADEVMSPLDLDAPAMPKTAGGEKPGPGPRAAASGAGDSWGGPRTGERNPTVLCTVRGKLPTADALPLYVPLLRLTLSAEEQADAAAELDAASAVVTPALGPADSPAAATAAAAMTATQRKKLRRAERIRSAEASQDDSAAHR